jgi:hypothetical protein
MRVKMQSNDNSLLLSVKPEREDLTGFVLAPAAKMV